MRQHTGRTRIFELWRGLVGVLDPAPSAAVQALPRHTAAARLRHSGNGDPENCLSPTVRSAFVCCCSLATQVLHENLCSSVSELTRISRR